MVHTKIHRIQETMTIKFKKTKTLFVHLIQHRGPSHIAVTAFI